MGSLFIRNGLGHRIVAAKMPGQIFQLYFDIVDGHFQRPCNFGRSEADLNHQGKSSIHIIGKFAGPSNFAFLAQKQWEILF